MANDDREKNTRKKKEITIILAQQLLACHLKVIDSNPENSIFLGKAAWE